MSGPTHSSPYLVRSTFLSSSRKDVLWNVVEPGDPYDIRKYFSIDKDPWSPSCLGKKPSSWVQTCKWFVCSNPLKSRGCASSLKIINIGEMRFNSGTRRSKDESSIATPTKFKSGNSPSNSKMKNPSQPKMPNLKISSKNKQYCSNYQDWTRLAQNQSEINRFWLESQIRSRTTKDWNSARRKRKIQIRNR